MRSYYATPWELRYRPWSLDVTPDDSGNPPFFFNGIVDPYAGVTHLQWTTDDWDPALRFWTLPFDPQLTEWLKSVDPSAPSIMAAREFASQEAVWGASVANAVPLTGWLEAADLFWQPSTAANRGFDFIKSEIGQLQQLMQDDRDRYMAEIEAQADGLADYVIAFIGASQERHPWTIELINCGLAMGNVAYMRWKSLFNRVRPSFLCPGLAPPFGPPGHPAFPSGHATLGHLIGLFLLEIPGICKRFGEFGMGAKQGTPVALATLAGTNPINSPLMWLAARLAKNRERLGVHYPSDSSAGRHLAAGMWNALTAGGTIHCPTFRKVLQRAAAEWPA